MRRADVLAALESALGLRSSSTDARLDAVAARLRERAAREAARKPRPWCVGCVLAGPVPEAELNASGLAWFVGRWKRQAEELAEPCRAAKVAGRPDDCCTGGKVFGGFLLNLARRMAANGGAP